MPSASPLNDIVIVAEIWIRGGRPLTSAGLIYSGRIKSRQGLKQGWDLLNQTLGGKLCTRAETTTRVASLTDFTPAAVRPDKNTHYRTDEVQTLTLAGPLCPAVTQHVTEG